MDFKLYTHISNRLLHKTLPAFCLTMNHSFVIAIIRPVLKEHFAWNQLKVDYLKSIGKEKKRAYGSICLLVIYISVKKNYRKLFRPSLTLIFSIFGEREKCKLYMFKKVRLGVFKELLKKYACNSTFMFFNMFLFCLKGY